MKNILKSFTISCNKKQIDNIIINDIVVKENPIFEEPVRELEYSSQYILLKNDKVVSLPCNPIPFVKLKIINLGNSNIKIVSRELLIYNTFFAPKGSQQVFLQENNVLEFIFVKDGIKSIWIAK